MSLLARARRLDGSRRRIAYEAFLWAACVRIALACLPFRWIAPRLGTPMTETGSDLPAEQVQQVRVVSWALQVAYREAPWLGACLAQAVTAKMMLRRRGIPSTLYLGVRRDDELKAHAWLRCGDVMLTGGPQRQGFTVVMALGDPGSGDP